MEFCCLGLYESNFNAASWTTNDTSGGTLSTVYTGFKSAESPDAFLKEVTPKMNWNFEGFFPLINSDYRVKFSLLGVLELTSVGGATFQPIGPFVTVGNVFEFEDQAELPGTTDFDESFRTYEDADLIGLTEPALSETIRQESDLWVVRRFDTVNGFHWKNW